MAAPEIETVNLLPDYHFSIPSMRGRIADRLGLLVMRYFKDFLRDFGAAGDAPMNEDNGDGNQNALPERKYTRSLWEVVHQGKNTIAVDFKDMEMYNDNLAKAVLLHYYRCYPFLCQGVLNCIRDEFDVESVKESLARRQIMVAFTNTPVQFNLRELRCNLIGQLVRITGQVVRTTPVHPELTYGHFECELCGADIPEVEQQFRYVQPTRCSNERCQNTNKFKLNLSKSMCVDFQKVRVQETQAELPRGAVPRTLDVIVRGAAVETANPGDECHFYGCLLVVPDISALSGRQPSTVSFEPTSTFKHQPGMEREGVSGLKALGVRELTYRVVFLAHNCESSNVKYGGIGIDLSRATSVDYIRSQLNDEDLAKLYDMSINPNLWRSICDSLFPTIYGSEEVKKGIILQLFGGVIKYTPEGTQLRGDINICIIGDPSTAKSQFLKQIQQFYPRAVYTSGKASTAAGLTAAVVKDEETHQFVIEAGALMLADRSICCIDEFDKMDIKDQVAIHEAMEQQTISIAKAGVKATLNARASILAAANPIGGRYDKTKSLRQNVYLSAPIMSRFDLLFVLIDDCDENVDRAVATRILDLHTGDLAKKLKDEEDAKREGRITYSKEDVQRYIIFAKHFRPIITPPAEEVLVQKYLQLRRRDRTAGYGGAGRGGAVRGAFRTTVRQLESLVRLSEAIARMQCLTKITPTIVEQAFDLLSKSIVRVEEPEFVVIEDAASMSNADEAAELNRNTAAVNAAAANGAAPANAAGGGLTIPYSEFVDVSNTLLARLTHCDRHNIDVHRSELVQWYLESIEAEIVDEADFGFRKLKTERIIGQMVRDKTLLEVRDRDLMPSAGQEPPAEDADRLETQPDASEPLLILNPNAQLPENFLDADEPFEEEPPADDADVVDADAEVEQGNDADR